jgi:hypothetical protein
LRVNCFEAALNPLLACASNRIDIGIRRLDDSAAAPVFTGFGAS